MYWDAASKTYIPVPGGHSAEPQPVTMTVEDQAILSNPAADAPLEMKKPSLPPLTAAPPPPVPVSAASSDPEPVPTSSTAALEKKDDDDSTKKDKDEKPRSLAAVKVALKLQCQCTKCEIQSRWLRNAWLFSDHERYGALGKDPESSKGHCPGSIAIAEDWNGR